jgi:hypothetical protein
MKTCRNRILALSVLGLVLVIGSAGMGHGQHQPDPNSPRFLAVTALMEFIQSTGEEPVHQFIEEMMSPAVKAEVSESDLADLLRSVRSDFSGATFQGAMPEGPFTVVLMFQPSGPHGFSRLTFEIEAEPPHRFIFIYY